MPTFTLSSSSRPVRRDQMSQHDIRSQTCRAGRSTSSVRQWTAALRSGSAAASVAQPRRCTSGDGRTRTCREGASSAVVNQTPGRRCQHQPASTSAVPQVSRLTARGQRPRDGRTTRQQGGSIAWTAHWRLHQATACIAQPHQSPRARMQTQTDPEMAPCARVWLCWRS
jgi:hypothetical protein